MPMTSLPPAANLAAEELQQAGRASSKGCQPGGSLAAGGGSGGSQGLGLIADACMNAGFDHLPVLSRQLFGLGSAQQAGFMAAAGGGMSRT